MALLMTAHLHAGGAPGFTMATKYPPPTSAASPGSDSRGFNLSPPILPTSVPLRQPLPQLN